MPSATNAAIPVRQDPRVVVTLMARPNGSWFWRVWSTASTLKLMGEDWCPQNSYMDIDGDADRLEKRIALVGGAVGQHQVQVFGSSFEPSEISRLAVEAYRGVLADLERRHGSRVPRLGLRSDA